MVWKGLNADENAKAGGWNTPTYYNLLDPFFALNRARENGESMFGKQQALFLVYFSLSIISLD